MFTVLLHLINTALTLFVFYLSDRWNILIMYLCLFFSPFGNFKAGYVPAGDRLWLNRTVIQLGLSGNTIAIIKVLGDQKKVLERTTPPLLSLRDYRPVRGAVSYHECRSPRSRLNTTTQIHRSSRSESGWHFILKIIYTYSNYISICGKSYKSYVPILLLWFFTIYCQFENKIWTLKARKTSYEF